MTDMSLGGLRDAAGLAPRERDTVDRLVRSLRGHASHNRKLNSYYEGTFRVSEMGIKVDPKLLSVSQVCHWPEKAVDALADRVKLTGFAGGEQALALAKETGLASAYSSHLVDKYVNGCMFCVVGRGPRGPMVRFHDALSARALASSPGSTTDATAA